MQVMEVQFNKLIFTSGAQISIYQMMHQNMTYWMTYRNKRRRYKQYDDVIVFNTTAHFIIIAFSTQQYNHFHLYPSLANLIVI